MPAEITPTAQPVATPSPDAGNDPPTRKLTRARWAAICTWTAGFGFGSPAIYGTWHFATTDAVWRLFGLPTYGDGPFEHLGIHTSTPLLAGFVAVCATEALTGMLLWSNRPAGRRLALGLLPVELAYWIGFALPAGPLLGLARTAILTGTRQVSTRPDDGP